jgi:ABC-type nitrate/sulfonate/bicarbonate transport system substrate-binding protein
VENQVMLTRLVVAAVSFVLAAPTLAEAQQDKSKIILGYSKCAHCFPMALTPGLTDKLTIEPIGFNTASDVLTALVSKSVDVAQVTYLHFITALDKGFDVVAISGKINGGSEILVQPKLALAAGDWPSFRKLVLDRKAQRNPLKVAASRGSAQDIHMRGELMINGIDVGKDIEFINIPNPADHAAALQRGEVDVICTVEPFASQIKLAGIGGAFAQPYGQAAGKLTNLIVTRSDVIDRRPRDVQETVNAVVKLVDKLNDNAQIWADVIVKHTGLDMTTARAALKNAYPDYRIYRGSAFAIAGMMSDLKYVSRDVSADIDRHIDYRFLAEAVKKPKGDLGF